MVLPNYIVCPFEKNLSELECEVSLLGQKQKVKTKDILLVKTPKFTEKQSLLFFNEKTKKWESAQLTNISSEQYEISWTHEGKVTSELLPINTIKLQPLNFEKDLSYADSQTTYARCQIVERERKLLHQTEYHFLDWNQLFELDYNVNRMSEDELVEKWDADQEKHLLGGRLNVFVDDGDRSKLEKLFTLGPMIS